MLFVDHRSPTNHWEQQADIQQLYYLSNLFFILVLGLVKCSTAFLITNLTVNRLGSLRHASRKHKMALGGVLILTITWTVASIVVLALPCGSQTICVGTVRQHHRVKRLVL